MGEDAQDLGADKNTSVLAVAGVLSRVN